MEEKSIKDIAKEAGVSVSTVSRVLNNSKPVSDELRTRVEKVIEKYNFRPNAIARSLSVKETRLLGVITPQVSGFFHSQLISHIEATAALHGYSVIIANIRGSYKEEKERILLLQDRQVDGIVLLHENTPEEMAELKSVINIPLVMATIRVKGDPYPTVTVDDVKAAQDATDYLIQLGHRKIAGVFSHSYSSGELRARGFKQALQAADLSANQQWILEESVTAEGGARAINTLLNLDNKPTAIFFADDEMAIGAMEALKQEGIAIPDDMSICGFDHIKLGTYLTPKLTTVHQPVEEIAKLATEILIDQIEGKTLDKNIKLLPHYLVREESTRPWSSEHASKV